MDKPNYYAILPATVRYSSDIRPMAKLLFAEITALSNKDGYCTATNKYLSNCYDVSTRTINNSLEDLKVNGFIKVDIVKNTTGTWRKIYPLMDIQGGATNKHLQENSTPYEEMCKGGVSESATQRNSTRNNNKMDVAWTETEVKQYGDSLLKDMPKLLEAYTNQLGHEIKSEWKVRNGLAFFYSIIERSPNGDAKIGKRTINSHYDFIKSSAPYVNKANSYNNSDTDSPTKKQTKPTCDYNHHKLETKCLVHQFDYNKYFELANQEIGTKTGALKGMYPEAYQNDLPLYESKLKELTELKNKDFSHHHNINELNLFELIYAQMPNPYQTKFRAYRMTAEDSKEETLRRFKIFLNDLGDYKSKFGNLRLLSKQAL